MKSLHPYLLRPRSPKLRTLTVVLYVLAWFAFCVWLGWSSYGQR